MPRPAPPTSLRAALRRQRLLLTALLAVAAVLLVAMSGAVPLAGKLLGALLLGLATLRIIQPEERLGGLAVRGAAVDAAVLAVLGLGLLILSSAPNL